MTCKIILFISASFVANAVVVPHKDCPKKIQASDYFQPKYEIAQASSNSVPVKVWKIPLPQLPSQKNVANKPQVEQPKIVKAAEVPAPPPIAPTPSPAAIQPAIAQGPLQALAQGSNQEQFIKLHNEYRSQHGAGPLSWDDEMAKRAQTHAESCVWGHNSIGSKIGIGQNLYAGTNATPLDAVKGWYDEVQSYDFNTHKSKDGKDVYHFTQLVWKDSTKLGCGVAECQSMKNLESSGKMIHIVCDYNPQGNVYQSYGDEMGLFRQNVRPKSV